MLQSLLDKVSEIITAYGSWGVFLVSILEEIIAPIPSTLTIMGASFVLLAPYKTFGAVFLPALVFVAIPAALGMAVGGMIIYGLVFFGERIIIDRWGKWFNLSPESIDKMKNYFQTGYADEVVLVTLRAIPIFPNSLISGVCGLLHYPVRSFFIFSVLGGIPRALLMALIGWWAEGAYMEFANVLSGFENIVLVACAILGLGALVIFYFKGRKKRARHENL
jgi:membrane protein DedA with SNARE-associated domain